jgi:nucleotide-binding universal stress UspA family protein
MNDFKKIMVAIDFSKISATILEAGQQIAARFEGEVEAVFVVESLTSYANFATPHISLDVMEKDLIEQAEKRMEEYLSENTDPSVPQTGKVLNGKVSEQLVSYAEKQGCDLIVIATHTCSGIERALYGSVTEKVVKTAHCPVLTINPC